MKKLAIIALTMSCAVGAFAQGTVNFANRVTAVGLYAPVYGVNPTDSTLAQRGNHMTNGGTINYGGAPQITGTGFTAALYGSTAGSDEASLMLVSTAPFRTNANLAGIINGPTTGQAVPGVPTGAQATFQIRAWDNRGGTVTTWAAAMADPTIAQGSSALFTPVGTLGGGAITPLNLVGLTSFNLAVVPEPSVIALGVLGLGALLLRRRK